MVRSAHPYRASCKVSGCVPRSLGLRLWSSVSPLCQSRRLLLAGLPVPEPLRDTRKDKNSDRTFPSRCGLPLHQHKARAKP